MIFAQITCSEFTTRQLAAGSWTGLRRSNTCLFQNVVYTCMNINLHKFVCVCVCVCVCVTGYHAGLWDNCHYNVTENDTLKTCVDKLTRKFAQITSNFDNI